MPIVKTALTVKDLPPPPPDKTGWPWTEQTEPLPELMPDGSSEWPLISIVTPSYNQGDFIEETIRSVLLQGYPNLEYIIIDGGSTDNSIEIIQKYKPFLAYWISEPDRGQSHGINKGFYKATGQLIGWQNSDDFYFPHAFEAAAKAAVRHNQYDVFYGSRCWLYTEEQNLIRDHHMSPFDLNKMIPNTNMSNQSTFFTKKIFENNNFIDESFNHCMDHEFFWRLIFRGYCFLFVPRIDGCFRMYGSCKGKQTDNDYIKDTVRICKLVYKNSRLPLEVRQKAWAIIRYHLCISKYSNNQLDEFREGIKELVKFRGISAIDFGILTKYIASSTGLRSLEIKSVKKIKYFYGIYFGNRYL